MALYLFTIALCLALSFYCSLIEAVLLGTTAAEVDAIKKSDPESGRRFAKIWDELDITLFAVLALNSVVTTLGAVAAGALAVTLSGGFSLPVAAVLMTVAFLFFSEVIPKNLGTIYRGALQRRSIGALEGIRRVMAPVTAFYAFTSRMLARRAPAGPVEDTDREIILMAEQAAKDGTLTKSESNIVANALRLDDVRVAEIMTPRPVVAALNRAASVADVFREYPNLPFGRMPVYQGNLDHIVGIVRRRDLLKAKANDQDNVLVGDLLQEVHFIPESATAAHALQLFLRTHQQLAVSVDEFGSVAGVISLEDVFEHILGREIFEKDDLAVDMRELARAKVQKQSRAALPSPPKKDLPPAPR